MANINEKGYWQNKEGKYIHPDMVPVDKQLEDELCEKLINGARGVAEIISEFKTQAFEECYSFNDLLRQKYDMERITSVSGAVTLKNFDGTMEVQIQVAKLITFDQKLTLAKDKIDEYLEEKTAHSDAEIRTLITRVFDVKNGKVDAKQILSLKAYPIEHTKWKDAMAMIDEATEIAGTKSYIRFRARKDGKIDGAMENIVMDIASAPLLNKDDRLKECLSIKEKAATLSVVK